MHGVSSSARKSGTAFIRRTIKAEKAGRAASGTIRLTKQVRFGTAEVLLRSVYKKRMHA